MTTSVRSLTLYGFNAAGGTNVEDDDDDGDLESNAVPAAEKVEKNPKGMAIVGG